MTRTLEEYLTVMESIVTGGLEELGLPTEQGPYFIVGEEERPLDLIELVRALGYEEGGAEDNAAQTLILLLKIRHLRASGDMDAAILAGIELGEDLMHDEFYEMWKIGRRTHEAGQKAACATWGSPQDRRAKSEELRRMFDEERPKSISNEAAYCAVAKRTGVPKRTVRRAVSGH
jgi:hypothetical protein